MTGNHFERGLAAVQYGAPIPSSPTAPRILSGFIDVDPVDTMESQILQLVAYDSIDPFIGMEYWREVRRNWRSEGVDGLKFQKLLGNAVKVVLAEENARNYEHYQDLELHRTLRRWGFYA